MLPRGGGWEISMGIAMVGGGILVFNCNILVHRK